MLIYNEIPGWISDPEAEMLFNIAQLSYGPILEIGFMFGKSTSIICEAIKNRNVAFDSYDINFSNIKQFENFYLPIHGSIRVPDIVNEYSFSKNKSFLDIASENLAKQNLLQYVNLHPENFKTISNRKFSLIYCDAMHDVNEMNLNIHSIISLSSPGTQLLIHDIAPFISHLPDSVLKLESVIDSMGVFTVL